MFLKYANCDLIKFTWGIFLWGDFFLGGILPRRVCPRTVFSSTCVSPVVPDTLTGFFNRSHMYLSFIFAALTGFHSEELTSSLGNRGYFPQAMQCTAFRGRRKCQITTK